MIIVTGGAGFIGSNLIAGLNQRGFDDILVVDDLSEGVKFRNIADLRIADYMDKDDFLAQIKANPRYFGHVEGVFHEGACSATTEWDGKFMMKNNYEYSKELLHACQVLRAPYLYASSASVYGSGPVFIEDLEFEKPLNVYGYSKFQFDQYVRRMALQLEAPVVGFRYFNVYGPREDHKGSMSSVAYHFNNQIRDTERCKLFAGTEDYADGEQRRDFVYVDDCVAVNLWFLDNPQHSGIFNLGTGKSQSFNEVAKAVIAWHGKGEIEYIPFPDHLKGRYQSFTEADISALRAVGCAHEFHSVEQGVPKYLNWLATQAA